MNRADLAQIVRKFQDCGPIERIIKSGPSGHWTTLTFLTCRREDRRVDQKEKSASLSCPITRRQLGNLFRQLFSAPFFHCFIFLLFLSYNNHLPPPEPFSFPLFVIILIISLILYLTPLLDFNFYILSPRYS